MNKNALLAAFAVTLASAPLMANAAENPFAQTDLKAGYMTDEAAYGHDMKGNKVEFTTPFRYGGDSTGAYAGGKIGTGAKDPSVCGTFSNASCSIHYVK